MLNNGPGSWAFEGLARQLAGALWIDVSPTPRRYNYLLHADDFDPASCGDLFIPYSSIRLAADKRLIARAFADHAVPAPETHVFDTLAGAQAHRRARPDQEWCLKFPTGCGAAGHRMLTDDVRVSSSWPRPLLVQEFVRLEKPEVYRLYAAGGKLFGWVARRFPEGTRPSPWVAHARGARYEVAGAPPPGAVDTARRALEAAGLFDSFGCVDLLQTPKGPWVALEVGTDGLFNHVDRDVGDADLAVEIQRRIAEAFWARVGPPPWGAGEWRPR
ncbi:hypothetical protein FRUB_04023 [Fimbriiglobus ruber]|uniref:ATP-grasp domain-containing protein n=1 Tax=Fimbriiglobus ruber TaxID=1908690 RepID=A0A225DZY8_9BACT|nr:hypothetical protein FRUB_04023 [Fimbriiglobus ruber]